LQKDLLLRNLVEDFVLEDAASGQRLCSPGGMHPETVSSTMNIEFLGG
jgi:hypothetical protein